MVIIVVVVIIIIFVVVVIIVPGVESHVGELLRHSGVHQALPPELLNGVPLVQVSLSTVI